MSPSSAPRTSRIWIVGLAVVAVIAVAVWFLRPNQAASASPPIPEATARKAEAQLDLQAVSDLQDKDHRASVEADAPKSPTEEPPPAAQAEAPAEPADLAARDELIIKVVDERQTPIFDASVTIRGLRKEGDEGSWYSRRDEATAVRTERDGRAVVPYERWTDIDAKTVRVDLVVEHADFIPFNESSFVLSPGEHVIALKQGSMVWVTAWHGSRERVVPEISIAVEWQAQLDQDGWVREPNGSWSTTRLAPGPHWITATHSSSELGSLASDFVAFELAEYGRVDLALELKPLATLRGRLDDAVPRPIVDGHVWLNLHASAGNLGLSSDHEAAVAADGTFEIPGLRAASGQLIALCDGWVSKQVPPRTLEESRWQPAPDATPEKLAQLLAQAQAEDRIAQPVDAREGEVFVVEMERAGELEVHVIDESCASLEGVHVSASPNVYWNGVGSSIVPWRSWDATTDGHGLARIANLPVDDSLWFGAQSATHQMRKEDRDRNPSAVIESGKTTSAELVLEKLP
jgi:hypothetical protein